MTHPSLTLKVKNLPFGEFCVLCNGSLSLNCSSTEFMTFRFHWCYGENIVMLTVNMHYFVWIFLMIFFIMCPYINFLLFIHKLFTYRDILNSMFDLLKVKNLFLTSCIDYIKIIYSSRSCCFSCLHCQVDFHWLSNFVFHWFYGVMYFILYNIGLFWSNSNK